MCAHGHLGDNSHARGPKRDSGGQAVLAEGSVKQPGEQTQLQQEALVTVKSDQGSPVVSGDDQLSAAELRRRNAGAVDLWLASGMVSFWQVVARAVIRSGASKTSSASGILEVPRRMCELIVPTDVSYWSAKCNVSRPN